MKLLLACFWLSADEFCIQALKYMRKRHRKKEHRDHDSGSELNSFNTSLLMQSRDERPEDRNSRWRLRSALISSVDERFARRILPRHRPDSVDGIAASKSIDRCTKERGCLPDFIVIGAQKGGTTSLHHYLDFYCPGGIVTSKREELNFFTERYYKGGLDWLRQAFPKSAEHAIRGYKSPNYFPHPLVPYRLHSILPHVKLVLLLREPVSRAVSAYAMGQENGKEPKGLRTVNDALSSELLELRKCLVIQQKQNRPRLACIWNKFYPGWDAPRGLPRDSWNGMTGPKGSYLMPGLYALQLRHWLRSFPLSAFFITTSKAFNDNTSGEMRRLLSFLKHDDRKAMTCNRINEKVLQSRYRTKHNGRASSSWSKDSTILREDLKAELRFFFRPFNEELWSILGRHLDW